ncbi:hypothetical protein NE865_06144 [Phthorimaea operculella]|nr:hypothetical protein NE865_06144 [Phthorimaea operculella]
MTALVGVLILTLLILLSVGIGLGYHYCLVEHRISELDDAITATTTSKTTTNVAGFIPREAQNFAKIPAKIPSLPFKPAYLRFLMNPRQLSEGNETEKASESEVMVPLNVNDSDFSLLLAKIKGMHRNVTVHFVDTPDVREK